MQTVKIMMIYVKRLIMVNQFIIGLDIYKKLRIIGFFYINLRRFRYEFVKSAIVVYVKMDLSNDNEKVDLTLEIDSSQALFLEDNLDHYQRGNRIGFNATILRIGTNDETRKFKLLEIWEEEGFKELPEFVTHDGRYEIETGKKSFRNF